MYICNDCGGVTYHLRKHREYHTELTSGPYEEYELCPHCGSNDVEEAEYCAECGSPICTSSKVIGDDAKAYCEDCYEKIEERESANQIKRQRRSVRYGYALRIDGRAFEPA